MRKTAPITPEMFRDWCDPDEGYGDFVPGNTFGFEHFIIPYHGGHAYVGVHQDGPVRFADTAWSDGNKGSKREFCPELKNLPADFDMTLLHSTMTDPEFSLEEITLAQSLMEG